MSSEWAPCNMGVTLWKVSTVSRQYWKEARCAAEQSDTCCPPRLASLASQTQIQRIWTSINAQLQSCHAPQVKHSNKDQLAAAGLLVHGIAGRPYLFQETILLVMLTAASCCSCHTAVAGCSSKARRAEQPQGQIAGANAHTRHAHEAAQLNVQAV